MNKQNNNNLFDKDDLLKLLNKKESGNKKSFADLDDFDKEALQGFESLEDTSKATDLLNEIDKKISARVGGQNANKRKPFIWIGAAASIVLIILISVFVVKQSHKELESTTIALHTPATISDKTVITETLPTLTNSDGNIASDIKSNSL